jgi:hypothetical protein
VLFGRSASPLPFAASVRSPRTSWPFRLGPPVAIHRSAARAASTGSMADLAAATTVSPRRFPLSASGFFFLPSDSDHGDRRERLWGHSPRLYGISSLGHGPRSIERLVSVAAQGFSDMLGLRCLAACSAWRRERRRRRMGVRRASAAGEEARGCPTLWVLSEWHNVLRGVGRLVACSIDGNHVRVCVSIVPVTHVAYACACSPGSRQRVSLVG